MSMTGILGQLKWKSLEKRRKDNRLILLYKGLKGKARIPTDDLLPKTNYFLLKLLHYDLQFACLLPHVFVNTNTV